MKLWQLEQMMMALQFLLGEIVGGYWLVPYDIIEYEPGDKNHPGMYNITYDVLDVEEIEGWSGE